MARSHGCIANTMYNLYFHHCCVKKPNQNLHQSDIASQNLPLTLYPSLICSDWPADFSRLYCYPENAIFARLHANWSPVLWKKTNSVPQGQRSLTRWLELSIRLSLCTWSRNASIFFWGTLSNRVSWLASTTDAGLDCLSLSWLASNLREAIGYLQDAIVHFGDAQKSSNTTEELRQVKFLQ